MSDEELARSSKLTCAMNVRIWSNSLEFWRWVDFILRTVTTGCGTAGAILCFAKDVNGYLTAATVASALAAWLGQLLFVTTRVAVTSDVLTRYTQLHNRFRVIEHDIGQGRKRASALAEALELFEEVDNIEKQLTAPSERTVEAARLAVLKQYGLNDT